MQTKHVKRLAVVVAAAALVSIGAPGRASAAEKYKGYERGNALISVEELKKLVDAKDPKLVVLAVANIAEYRLPGHIPGAIRVWRPDYEPKANAPYPYEGMMLNRSEFEAFARRLGIDNDSKLVIYDHKYDATRVWWGFFIYGKTDARVLDGGMQAWKAAGYATDMLAPADPKPGGFIASARNDALVAGIHDVWRAKTDSETQLWDTREKKEWTGEELKKGAYRKGRIPWARFFNWKELKKPVAAGEDFTEFKTAAEVRQVLQTFGVDRSKEQILYCQSAVRTTTHIFTLYALGWDITKLRNYDGSWIEWSYFAENPIVAGE